LNSLLIAVERNFIRKYKNIIKITIITFSLM